MHISLETKKYLMECYGESHRAYHNISHIKECLRCLDEITKELKLSEHSKFLIELIIWFHDVVYAVGVDVKHGENERHSMDRFLESLEAKNLSDSDQYNIANAIVLSSMHTVDLAGLSYEQKLFLDIDLHSMGKSYDVFEENGINIRKEYSFVPEDVFIFHRKKFFDKLLERENIFYIPEMRFRYEERTRENIDRWLRSI